MSIAQDTALAFILQAYADQLDALRPAKDVPAAKALKAKVAKVRTPKAPKPEAKPFQPTFAYSVGSLDASTFLTLIRRAGMRPNNHGVNVIHPAMVKQDEIEAINGFVGYDYRANHGTSLDAARRKATLAMRDHLGTRSAKSTANGWVAGMKDESLKRRQDLLGREVMAAESTCQLTARLNDLLSRLSGADMSSGEQDSLASERNLVQGLIMVERERIAAIREELARLA